MTTQKSETENEEPSSSRFNRLRGLSATVVLAIVTVSAFIVSLGLGRYPVPPLTVVKILFSNIYPLQHTWPKVEETVVMLIRLPRILAAMLVGASLAIAGASFQGLFRNPLVSPDILGVSAGASVGAGVAILFFDNNSITQLFAFTFALGAVGLTVFVGSRIKGNPTLSLILAGIAVGSLFGSFISLIKYVADPTNKLPAITYWLLGSFAAINSTELEFAAGPMLAGMTILILIRWRFNVLAMGEEEAKSLGLNTNRLRLIVVTCCTIITASGVCIAGTIGWVGLVMPHVGRILVGPNHKVLLPVTVLLGATYLLLMDDIVRTVSSIEVPIGIVTAMVGAPFFIYLLHKGNWGWG